MNSANHYGTFSNRHMTKHATKFTLIRDSTTNSYRRALTVCHPSRVLTHACANVTQARTQRTASTHADATRGNARTSLTTDYSLDLPPTRVDPQHAP
eukprot:5372876-Pleurochrysis_carterae.AAC.1